jgi:putative nucleotidyltransferase with HDIG domain
MTPTQTTPEPVNLEPCNPGPTNLESHRFEPTSPEPTSPEPADHDQNSPQVDIGQQLELYAREIGTTHRALLERSEMLEVSNRAIIAAFAVSIEARDPHTQGHTMRVTEYAIALARMLGWNKTKLEEVRLGCAMHDLGKIAIPDHVLLKPGKLTDEEFASIKTHPVVGARMIQGIQYLEPARPYILHHHERYDGRGYPDQLEGEQIPPEGRLTAIADAFDAMTSNRIYRSGMGQQRALEEIQNGAGKQFDPAMAEVFVRAMRSGGIPYLVEDQPITQE